MIVMLDLMSRMSSLGGNESARRATLRALISRRDSVIAEKRRSQLQAGRDSASGYLYELPDAGVIH